MNLEEAVATINKQNTEIEENYLKKIESSVLPPPPERAFESIATLRKKAVLEAKNEMKAINGSLETGVTCILEHLKEHSPEQFEELSSWFMQHTDAMIDCLKADDTSSNDESLAQKLSFPQELLNNMRQAAQHFFDEKEYDKAAAAMTVCIAFDGKIFEFWLFYGSILQANHDDVGALYAFQVAQSFDIANPSVYAYMAKSWVAISMQEEAQQCIMSALDCCKDLDGYEDFRDYCYALHAYSKKQMKNL